MFEFDYILLRQHTYDINININKNKHYQVDLQTPPVLREISRLGVGLRDLAVTVPMLQGETVSEDRTWLWTGVPGMGDTSRGSGGMEGVEVGALKEDKVPFGKVFLSSMEQIFGKIVFRTNNNYFMN